MGEVRKGRQTPTQSVVLPYSSTYGAEAIDIYNSTGRTAQEWQELLLSDILAVNEEGLWVHTKFGYSVPRRNGKNEIVAIREMYGLKKGERILHTAHRTTTTHSAWERLSNLLKKANIEVVSSYKAFGKEHLEVAGGGIIEFRTRTSKGGLGEGFDLLIIDEAQEYQDDQESALKYVVTDSKNPQTIFCGTPPTPVSSGTVFTKFRKATLEGQTVNSGWAEWSVPEQTDIRDIDVWYETNPSLGTVFTERSVTDEIGSDPIDFNIQRLGLWIRYNQKSAISATEWNELKADVPPELTGDLFVGIKYSKDGNVAMGVASKTKDDKIFLECIDCREVRAGDTWILSYINKPVADIADGDISSYLRAYKNIKAVKNSTLKGVRAVYSSFFVWLRDRDRVRRNPMVLVESIKVEKRVKRPFTDTEREQLLRSCATIRDKAMMEFLYSTAVRVSELATDVLPALLGDGTEETQ